MSKKNTLYFDLYRTPHYGEDNNPPPSHAGDFIEWLKFLILSVPEDNRDSVCIEAGDDGDWDRPTAELSVTWSRLETDEEFLERTSSEKLRVRLASDLQIRNEKAIYEALKKKYG